MDNGWSRRYTGGNKLKVQSEKLKVNFEFFIFNF